MLTLLVAAVLNGDPRMLTTGPMVEAQLKTGPAQVSISGTLERRSLGRKGAIGTALLLDDGTAVWLTSDAPPAGFELLLGKFVRVDGTLQSYSAASQSLMAPHLASPAKPIEVKRDLSALIDQTVRLVGTAENAKGGAVVLVDGTPVYVAKKDSWPDTLRTKRISLGGKLTRAQYLPQATVNAKGEISQGTTGASTDYVLRDATEPTAF
ncbi:MAG: hypothetical protein GQE15_38940 [Archangiaceae bacterium]|nr:hypothetical protein [Archangiaceae bacterium]